MIEDNQAEVALQMQKILAQARQEKAAAAEKHSSRPVEPTESFQTWVPACAPGEFLLQVTHIDNIYLCALSEPTWKEAAAIEMYAFRKTQDGRDYFSGEYERRGLLKKAIRWIADSSTKEIHNNPQIDQLDYGFADTLWSAVSEELFVQLNEAQALYASAKSFFSGALGQAVHPIILDVDGIIKKMFVFNAAEWNAVSMSDFERYQIVWMAYHEHTLKPQQELPSDAPPMDSRVMRAMLGRMPR